MTKKQRRKSSDTVPLDMTETMLLAGVKKTVNVDNFHEKKKLHIKENATVLTPVPPQKWDTVESF